MAHPRNPLVGKHLVGKHLTRGFAQAFRASRASEMAIEYCVIVAILALAITASVLDLGKTAGIWKISSLAPETSEITGSIRPRPNAGLNEAPLRGGF